MKRKIIALFSIVMLSFSMVACSKEESESVDELPKEETQQEDTTLEKLDKEEVIFDEEVVILDGDISIKIQGKSKITEGNSVGYMYKVSNMSDESLEFYVKDVEVNKNPTKTDLDEGLKMPLQPLTQISTQMNIEGINSLDDLKNTTGVFCIKTNEGIQEYEFELE